MNIATEGDISASMNLHEVREALLRERQRNEHLQRTMGEREQELFETRLILSTAEAEAKHEVGKEVKRFASELNFTKNELVQAKRLYSTSQAQITLLKRQIESFSGTDNGLASTASYDAPDPKRSRSSGDLQDGPVATPPSATPPASGNGTKSSTAQPVTAPVIAPSSFIPGAFGVLPWGYVDSTAPSQLTTRSSSSSSSSSSRGTPQGALSRVQAASQAVSILLPYFNDLLRRLRAFTSDEDSDHDGSDDCGGPDMRLNGATTAGSAANAATARSPRSWTGRPARSMGVRLTLAPLAAQLTLLLQQAQLGSGIPLLPALDLLCALCGSLLDSHKKEQRKWHHGHQQGQQHQEMKQKLHVGRDGASWGALPAAMQSTGAVLACLQLTRVESESSRCDERTLGAQAFALRRAASKKGSGTLLSSCRKVLALSRRTLVYSGVLGREGRIVAEGEEEFDDGKSNVLDDAKMTAAARQHQLSTTTEVVTQATALITAACSLCPLAQRTDLLMELMSSSSAVSNSTSANTAVPTPLSASAPSSRRRHHEISSRRRREVRGDGGGGDEDEDDDEDDDDDGGGDNDNGGDDGDDDDDDDGGDHVAELLAAVLCPNVRLAQRAELLELLTESVRDAAFFKTLCARQRDLVASTPQWRRGKGTCHTPGSARSSVTLATVATVASASTHTTRSTGDPPSHSHGATPSGMPSSAPSFTDRLARLLHRGRRPAAPPCGIAPTDTTERVRDAFALLRLHRGIVAFFTQLLLAHGHAGVTLVWPEWPSLQKELQRAMNEGQAPPETNECRCPFSRAVSLAWASSVRAVEAAAPGAQAPQPYWSHRPQGGSLWSEQSALMRGLGRLLNLLADLVPLLDVVGERTLFSLHSTLHRVMNAGPQFPTILAQRDDIKGVINALCEADPGDNEGV